MFLLSNEWLIWNKNNLVDVIHCFLLIIHPKMNKKKYCFRLYFHEMLMLKNVKIIIRIQNRVFVVWLHLSKPNAAYLCEYCHNDSINIFDKTLLVSIFLYFSDLQILLLLFEYCFEYTCIVIGIIILWNEFSWNEESVYIVHTCI